MTSRAKEDYLKAIYECEKAGGIAKTTQLAQKLSVRAATVTEMVQRLAKESPHPAITYRHHQGVRLTRSGRKEALAIIRKHRLLETFLFRTLKLSWDEVHKEAEVLEHHISTRVTKALDRHLDFPKFDPHGEPIPNEEGLMPPHPQLALSQINKSRGFKILSVNPVSAEFLANLEHLGIGIGTTGHLISRDPGDRTLSIKIEGRDETSVITLSQEMTDCIYVETQ